MSELPFGLEEISILGGNFSVYVLKDPRDNTVRYVGLTKNVRGRYNQHYSGTCPWGSRKERWMNELHDQGLKPLLEIVASNLTHEIAYVLEGALIEHYRGRGLLVNTDRVPGIKVLRGKASDEERHEAYLKYLQTDIGRKRFKSHIIHQEGGTR